MEISNNSINQPVSFYPKNTGNIINMAAEGENRLYQSNIFSPELNEQLAAKNHTKPIKKRRKSKRLNTIDTDYLPDGAIEDEKAANQSREEGNFFIVSSEKKLYKNIKQAFWHIIENTPLINYFYLKQKGIRIQKTVETLKDINQNVDELINNAVPYGEEGELYSSIAKNLTDAANVLGRVKKEF